MDIVRHLRYFVAVADANSFGAAARRLGMSQPPLSQRIQRLESELGVELFDRSRRQIQLTEAGNRLLPEAREVIQRADSLREVARAADQRSGWTLALPRGLAPQTLATVCQADTEHPAVKVLCADPSERAELLATGEVDVALLPATGNEVWHHQRIVLITRHDHAPSVPPHPSDLQQTPVACGIEIADPGLPSGAVTELARRGLSRSHLTAVGDHALALALVLSGSHVLLAPRNTPLHPDLTPTDLDGAPVLHGQRLFWARPSDASSPRGEALADRLHNALGPQDADAPTPLGGWGLYPR